MQWCSFTIGLIALAGACSAAVPPSAPALVRLGVPEGFVGSSAVAISDDGLVIVGTLRRASGVSIPARWTWADGWTPLFDDSVAGRFAQAMGVSADGRIVVGYVGLTGQTIRGFRWSPTDGAQFITDGAGAPGACINISGDGQTIVGGFYGTPTFTAFTRRAETGFEAPYPASPWIDSQAVDVSFDGSIAIGTATVTGTGPGRGFRTVRGQIPVVLEFVPAESHSTGRAISPDGSTIVGQTDAFAATWNAAGERAPLPSIPGASGFGAIDVSANGRVIVGAAGRIQNIAIVWIDRVAFEIQLLVPSEAVSGWEDLVARGVSADGFLVVGTGVNPCGQEEGWIARIRASAADGPGCRADYNMDDELNPDDLADFIGDFFAAPPPARADFNNSCGVDPDDLADYIGAYFAGC